VRSQQAEDAPREDGKESTVRDVVVRESVDRKEAGYD
jgi:hypothetical protein